MTAFEFSTFLTHSNERANYSRIQNRWIDKLLSYSLASRTTKFKVAVNITTIFSSVSSEPLSGVLKRFKANRVAWFTPQGAAETPAAIPIPRWHTLVSSRAPKLRVLIQTTMPASWKQTELFLGPSVGKAVGETHCSRLSGFPIFFPCKAVIPFVNSPFVLRRRRDHRVKNTRVYFCFLFVSLWEWLFHTQWTTNELVFV